MKTTAASPTKGIEMKQLVLAALVIILIGFFAGCMAELAGINEAVKPNYRGE